MERILIYAPNWLGDAVMALPAIADVRRAYPRARLDVAARPAVAPLFALVREVDETLLLGHEAAGRPKDSGTPYDLALLLPNSFHTALLAWRGGIRERWGYRGDWRRLLLTRAAPRPNGLHQVVYYQQLVAAFGIANGPSSPRIELTSAVVERGERILCDRGWDGEAPLMAMAPGAAYGSAKRWPAEYYGKLARSFESDGIRTVMVGSGADQPTGREIEHAAGGSAAINLIGQTTLAELAGVLKACRGVVSNDSGAMHLAAAIGAPLTALFGPTKEAETAPIGHTRWDITAGIAPELPSSGVTVLVNPVACRPCMLRDCPIDHPCMRGISVAHVRAATARQSQRACGSDHVGTRHPAAGTQRCS